MRVQPAPPTALSREFWSAAAEHRLVVPLVQPDRSPLLPAGLCVPGTASTDWSYVPSAGTGTVTTFSIVHRPPAAGF